MNILRIRIFNKMSISGDNILDTGPGPLAGLCHGDPVKGPHHLLHLLDQALNFVVRLCIDL
jgi:hypothetical protein